jgi:hypothetical protein
MLFGVSPLDPVMYLGVIGLLGVVAVLARNPRRNGPFRHSSRCRLPTGVIRRHTGADAGDRAGRAGTGAASVLQVPGFGGSPVVRFFL